MPRVVVVTVLMLVTATIAAVAPGATSATTKTFQDATGEDPAGPDITTVTASGDGSSLTLRVSIPTNATVTPDFRLRVWLDADDSLDTGLDVEGPSGIDHFLLVDPTRFRPDEAVLYRCTGGVNVCGPVFPASLDFTYAGGATFTVDARSLGLGRIDRVRFSVQAATGIGYDPVTREYDFTNWHGDTAPNEGDWVFAARPLRVVSFRATPTEPRAGRPLLLALAVTDNETGGPLAQGKTTCLLKVHGKRVPARARSLSRGRATCRFLLPRDSRGKRFQATIRVTAQGTTVGRALTGEVR